MGPVFQKIRGLKRKKMNTVLRLFVISLYTFSLAGNPLSFVQNWHSLREAPSQSQLVRTASDLATGTSRQVHFAPLAAVPEVANHIYSTQKNTELNVDAPGVLAGASDSDSHPLTAAVIKNPEHGTLTLNPDGSFTYLPNTGFSAQDSFTYTASDDVDPPNISAEATVQIDVINAVPVGNGDAYSTDEDQSLLISAPGVLGNDTDADLDSLAAVLVANPLHGDLTLSPSGSFTYLPDANYNGADSFTYQASDGQSESNTVTVDLTIDSVNDPPQAADDHYSTSEDTALTIGMADGVLSNDTDNDQETLTAAITAEPSHGTVSLSSDGSFVYTPDENNDQPDSFTYTASDGKVSSAPATVQITVSPVNDAPVAQADSYNVVEDKAFSVSAPGILANDTDVDSSITAAKDSEPAHGTLVFGTNGSFTYTPSANWSGVDSFSYHATDGEKPSATVAVNLAVAAANDAPAANNDSYTATEDTTLTVNSAEGVLANDTDIDSATLTAFINANATHGTVTLNTDGSFSYTPAANYNGPDSFTYQANDGTDNSNIATVNITVNPVNDPPVAVADNYFVNEDAILNQPAKGVLANDTDADKDTLHALVNQTTSNGALTLNQDGSFTYKPTANFTGSDTFTYYANDGQADSNVVTVTITVNPVNDPPTAVNDAYSMNEDTALNQPAPGVLANDTDIESNSLKAILVAGPGHGTLTLNQDGSFSYTPAANYNGADSFTYRANDGTVNSNNVATVSITVNPVNDAPVAANDSFTTDEDTQLAAVPSRSVLANDTDVDHDTLTVTLVQDVANGSLTLNADGTFSYLPDANFNGQDTFTYYASDKELSSGIATVTIRVNPVNDQPVAVSDSYSTNEDVAITTAAPGVLANDTDVENDSLTAKVVTGPSYGALTLNPNGSFTYTPKANYFGLDSFTYSASDGKLSSDPVTVSIEITPVNDAPIANAQTASVDEDSAINLTLTGSDVENDILTYTIVDQPDYGTLAQTGTGPSVRYTPNPNFDQQDTFTFKTNDGHLDSPIATVTINVRPINDPPVGVPESYSTDEDTPLSVPVQAGVRANDTDIDNSRGELSIALVTGPTKGTLSLSSDGSFTYVPTLNLNGPDSFVYRVYDGKAWAAETTTVDITINAVNDAPVAVADSSYQVTEQVPAAGQDTTTVSFDAAAGVLANDTDVENTPLQVVIPSGDSIVFDTEYATITLHKQGNFEYKQKLKDALGNEIEFPGANPTGKITFTYQVTDGELKSATVTVTITVLGVNDQPKLQPIPDLFINREGIREVPAPGLLKGASDPEKSPLTAAKERESYRVDCWMELDENTGDEYRVCEPWRNQNGDIIYMGTAIVYGDGSYSFDTEPGTVGYFEIDYKVCDDGAGDASLSNQPACTQGFVIVNVENTSLLKVTWVSPVQNDAWYRIDSPTVTLRFYPEILPDDQDVIDETICEPSCEIRIDFYDTITGRFKRLGVIDWKNPVFDLDPTKINLHWNEVTAALVNPLTGEASPHVSIFPLRLPGAALLYQLYNPLNFTRSALKDMP